MPEPIEIKVKKAEGGRTVTMTRTAHAETLLTRCERELGRLGVSVNFNDGGDLIFSLSDHIKSKERTRVIPILKSLVERGARAVSRSEHQLTWYDLKQAAGLIHAAKEGDKAAKETVEWADGKIKETRKKEGEALVAVAKEAVAKKKEARAASKPKPKTKAPTSGARKASLVPERSDEVVGA